VLIEFKKLSRTEQAFLAICVMYEGMFVSNDVIAGKIAAMKLLTVSDEAFYAWLEKMVAEVNGRNGG